MSDSAESKGKPEQKGKSQSQSSSDWGYQVVCWNDSINIMDYSTYVLRVVFNWPKDRAEAHMLQIHNVGKSVLVRDVFEKAEYYVHRLQGYGLHATMEKDE